MPPGAGPRFGDDPCAPVRAPGFENSSETDLIAALIAPWLGSFWYITRHITPVAKSEIASGANTTTLKAVAHRIRSVSTAKIRPRNVTANGTMTTQMTLFLIAVRMTWSLKRAL